MTIECSPQLLQLAVTGSLDAEQEAQVALHIETCSDCAAVLERMAGSAELQTETAQFLRPDEFGERSLDAAPISVSDFVVEYLRPSSEPGTLGRIGSYEVLDVVGRGGMGIVLKAFDSDLKRFVAIKALAPHLAHNSLARQRFIREAQAVAAVVNPHVIAIHQVHAQGKIPFLVMPLMSGETLATRLQERGSLEIDEVLRIGLQIAEGLAAAHRLGMVHRDVKPANILLDKGVDRAVLTDFGLARAADDGSLTSWGFIAGTPQYMSPEQARGEPLDHRSDLFSLGCVLYEMAVGVSPFKADSPIASLRLLLDESPMSLNSLNPRLPPWFVLLVEQLLEKSPDRRFASADELRDTLAGCIAYLQQPTHNELPAAVQRLIVDAAVSKNRNPFAFSFWSNRMKWLLLSRKRIATVSVVILVSAGLVCYAVMSRKMGPDQVAIMQVRQQFPHGVGQEWDSQTKSEYTQKCLEVVKKYPNSFGALEAIISAVSNGDPGPAEEGLKEAVDTAPLLHLSVLVGPAARLEPNPFRPHLSRLLQRVKEAPQTSESAVLLGFICAAASHDKTASLPSQFREAANLLLLAHADHPAAAAIADVVIIHADRGAQYVATASDEVAWANDLEPILRDLIKSSRSSVVKLRSQIAVASILERRNTAESNQEAAELLDHFLQEYRGPAATPGGAPSSEPGNLVWLAKEHLMALRAGSVGMPAPRTEGLDLLGKPLSLSDYRGKATLVVFWASWCSPCMAMTPHEVALAERYQNRPFAIFGINGDRDPAFASHVAEKNQITWRSLESGVQPGDTDNTPLRYGLIWKAAGWPTVVLVDHLGIVRYRWLGAPDSKQLDDAVEALVIEAEQAQQ